MEFYTTDICDAHEQEIQVVAPMFQSYGGRKSFCGPISTLKLFEDNGLVRTALEGPGGGRVLVVDGGGSLRCALVGDQLAALAVSNGWSGIVVFGCIRDARVIAGMDVGILAVATHPRKTVKKSHGDRDFPVTFGGVTFTPGSWLYADQDGVVVLPRPHTAQ